MQKIIDGLTKNFVSDWKNAWKWLSVQASLFVTALMVWITTSPTEFTKIIEMVEEPWRQILSLLFGFLLIYLRLKKQEN